MEAEEYFLRYILFNDMPLKIDMCEECKAKFNEFLEEKDKAINQTIMCLHVYNAKKKEKKEKTFAKIPKVNTAKINKIKRTKT